MYYKRNEPYRYTFTTPIPAQIASTDSVVDDFNCLIINISHNGLRIKSKQKVRKDEMITISYILLSKTFTLIGTVVWVKNIGRYNEFGVTLNTDITYQKDITAILKQLARKQE